MQGFNLRTSTFKMTTESDHTVDFTADLLANAVLKDDGANAGERTPSLDTQAPSRRLVTVYARAVLIRLHASSLVQPPNGMPALKDWYGSENEQTLVKKDFDSSAPNNPRDRRFRRDHEDGDVSKSVYRTLAQPSQMGNFKHQTLRSSERERDSERDRERGVRDREGLRNLSEKYDRDRLASPASVTLRGTKQRDTALHPPAGSSNRSNALAQSEAPTSRRRDQREPPKASTIEVGENLREGIDISKSRDNAESASSRNRPLLQSQKDPSASGREPNELEGEGEEFQRETLHPDKDDRELELDDSRRWRDDGKREALAREKYGDRDYRDRERVERNREREKSGETWSISNRNNRRWANPEEQRDARPKRSAPRERRLATTEDDTRERDDGRSREKEKQPAWMETYIPKAGGFVHGKDNIRAWKESLKEEAEKQESLEPGLTQGGLNIPETDHTSRSMASTTEKPLDEIQQFRLLMKQEEEKKKSSLVNESSVKDSDSVPVEAKSLGMQTPVSSATTDVLGAPTNNPHAIQPPSPNRAVSTTTALDIILGGLKRPLPFPTQHSAAAHPPEGISTDPNPDPSFSNIQSGSRLLQLGNRKIQPQASKSNRQSPSTTTGNFHADTDARQSGVLWSSPGPEDYSKGSSSESIPEQRGFVPFDPSDIMGRMQNSERSVFEPVATQPDLGQAYGAGGQVPNKGSRFAKFFDAKGRIDTQQSGPQVPSSMGFPSSSPMSGLNQEPGNFNSVPSGNADNRAMSDIFAMLHNTNQAQTANPTSTMAAFGQGSSAFPTSQSHQIHQHQPLPNGNLLNTMYDSNADDRTFLADRMMPGVRSASARSRDAVFSDPIDDPVQLGSQWIPPQRPDHELTPNSLPFYYANQQPASRNTIPAQSQYRDSSSPGPHQGLLSTTLPQGLPPGLANLGSRPPHDPLQSYYPNSPIGLHANTNPGATHMNGHPIQTFNDFGVGGMYNVGLQVGRGPSGLGQLRGPNAISNLGPPHLGIVDSHGPSEAQRLGLPLRSVNAGAFPPQQMHGGQVPNPAHMRRLPQGAPHMAPSNQGFNASESQSAHDLMALLMGKR